MAVETEWVDIEGYRDEITEYKFVLEDVNYDGETLEVEFRNERFGDSAIMENCEYKLYVDGEVVDQSEGTPRGSGGNPVNLSGKADPGSSWRYEFYSPDWKDSATNIEDWDGYLTFEGEVEELDMEVLGMDSTDSFVPKHEDWSITAEIGNNTDYPAVDKEIEVVVTGQDKSFEGTIEVTVDETSTKVIEFEKNEIADMLGIDEVGEGGYTVCVEV